MATAKYLQNVSLDPRVTPSVMGALTQVESSGNPNAVSPAGAQGIAQLMPGTAKDLGVDPFNASEAMAGAKKYLSYLLKQTGNLPDSLAAYNWGLGNVKKYGTKNLPEETKNYVQRVMSLMGRKDAGQTAPSVAAAPLNSNDPTQSQDQNPPSAASNPNPVPPSTGGGSGVGAGSAPSFSGYGKITPPPSQFTGSANPIAMVQTLLRNPLALSQGTPMAEGGYVKLPSQKRVPSKAFGFKRLQSSVAGPSVSDNGGGDSMAGGGTVRGALSKLAALVKGLSPEEVEAKFYQLSSEQPELLRQAAVRDVSSKPVTLYHSSDSPIQTIQAAPSSPVPISRAVRPNTGDVDLPGFYSLANKEDLLGSQFGIGNNVLHSYDANSGDFPELVRSRLAQFNPAALGRSSYPLYDATRLAIQNTGGKGLSRQANWVPGSEYLAMDPSILDLKKIENIVPQPPRMTYADHVANIKAEAARKKEFFDKLFSGGGMAGGGAVIRSAPRSKILGALSDAARYIDENALEPIQHKLERVPVGFSGTADDYLSGREAGLLGVLAPRFNTLSNVLNEASYGMPLTTGSGMTTGLKPEVGFAVMDASQFGNARPLARGAKNLAKRIAPALEKRAAPDVIESMFGPSDEWDAAKAAWDAAHPTPGYAGGGAIRGALGRLAARLGADELPNAIKPLEAVKEQGGQWLPGAAKQFSENAIWKGQPSYGMAKDPHQIWAEKAIPKYIERYMGAKGDPLANIQIPHGQGTKSWEEMTDPLISISSRKQFKDSELPDWAQKLSPETLMHEIGGNPTTGRRAAVQDYISHVLDHAATIPPEKLKNYDFPRLVQEVQKIDADRVAKMNTVEGQLEGTVPHKQYPSGYQWVEVQSPEALKNEGDVMGHCVGGYCDAVKSGQKKIYSLRDPSGKSHVTIEQRAPLDKSVMTDEEYSRLPADYAAKLYENPSINQIKGKQNLAPKPEYQPYIQDFIKSGNWSDVRDFSNAGLERTKILGQRAFNNGQLSQEEMNALEGKYGKFMTSDDMDDYLKSLGNPQTMKKGGSVKKCKGGGSCKCLRCLRKRLK